MCSLMTWGGGGLLINCDIFSYIYIYIYLFVSLYFSHAAESLVAVTAKFIQSE